MNAKEMMYEAELMYESISSQDVRGYRPREWSVMLTQAQENIVLRICEQGFDRNEMNRRKISKLISYAEITDTEPIVVDGTTASVPAFISVPALKNAWELNTPVTADNDTVYTFFPEDYFHRISGRVDASVFDTESPYEALSTLESVRLKPISYLEYNMNINNPFKQPYEELFWLIPNSSGHVIITNGYEPVKYYLEYIKKPKPIIVTNIANAEQAIEGYMDEADCELDSIVHREIVKETVRLAYAYLKDQLGYQIRGAEMPREGVTSEASEEAAVGQGKKQMPIPPRANFAPPREEGQ